MESDVVSTPDVVRTPLTEAIIEIRFPGDARIENWRGEFQAHVRDRYPILLVPNAVEGEASALRPYRFENDSRTASVGLAVNSYFHSTREYPGWGKFSANALEIWDVVYAAISPKRLSRLGIRYINRFTDELLGKVGGSFEASFLRPLVDDPRIYQSAFVTGGEASGMTVRVDFDRDKARLLVDIDCFEQDVHPEEIGPKIEELHSKLEGAFFSVLVPEYAARLKSAPEE